MPAAPNAEKAFDYVFATGCRPDDEINASCCLQVTDCPCKVVLPLTGQAQFWRGDTATVQQAVAETRWVALRLKLRTVMTTTDES
jgi:hypothetical protein